MIPLHCDSEKPRNNLKSYQNISSPKRELNSCLRLSGKLHPQNALSPMLVTLSGIIMLLKEEKAQHCPSPSKREG